MELIDIGANLGHESFQHDFDEVLARAREAGIVHMVVTGASREGSREALRLAKLHPGYYYFIAYCLVSNLSFQFLHVPEPVASSR